MSTDAVVQPPPGPGPDPVVDTGVAEEHLTAATKNAPSSFLHSPPDSNNATKTDGSDSELSDLDEAMPDIDSIPGLPKVEEEPEEEDIGEVLPDHWSGTVPVFKPTMHQFKDFKKFVRRACSRTSIATDILTLFVSIDEQGGLVRNDVRNYQNHPTRGMEEHATKTRRPH